MNSIVRAIASGGPGALALTVTELGLITALAAAAPVTEPRGSLEETVLELAGPATGGRGIGSASLDAAAERLASRLEAVGAVQRQLFTHEGHDLQNLLLRVEGSEPGAGWIVVGAHYDAQGVGEASGPHAGATHFGADDNASGTAVLVEVARRIAEEYDPPERGVLFVLFSGEESGLLGSRRFVQDGPVAVEEIRAMVNLDTVGRLATGGLTVFGAESARAFEDLLRGLDTAFGLEPRLVARSSGVSDDAPFAERGIPTLHLFTGAHADYHRPSDTADKLDLDGLETLADFTAELVDYLAQVDTELDFVPPGAEQALADPDRATQERRRVSFGSIPDFQYQGEGVLLSGVIPASPAAEAGMAKGDVIVEFAGAPVADLTDYSEAMKRHAPGDVVEVVFLRDGERRNVRVTLVERK